MAKLTQADKELLALVARSKPINFWSGRPEQDMYRVSDALLPAFIAGHSQLFELHTLDGQKYVRLTREAKVLIEWVI
jgi:hypothetical protein